ncbi:MAG TPA: acetate kinase [Bacteroidales bacterium]|nr:acetate kinase [Bacteroidales bacterium]
MKILVLNSGSSSIKFQLLVMPQETVMAVGLIDRIGSPKSVLKFESNGKKITREIEILDHDTGVSIIVETLKNPELNIIQSVDEISGVGHRVVHGGEWFNSSVVLSDDVVQKLSQCCELAPLHNPANIKGIMSAQNLLPHTTQCAAFDTAFHQTMPSKAFMYAIPYAYYEKFKVRKYGFHGISHQYVSQEAAKLAHIPYDEAKIIVCHLGNGASISAVKHGKSIDTTMGLTPLEGLMMGTRSGDLDVGAACYIMRKENLSVDQIDTLFNKKSGLSGVSGFSSDMRDIQNAAADGNERAQLALDMFAYRVKKYIGSYAAAMGGVDAIAFTGGIGENSKILRAKILQDFDFLGISLHETANNTAHGDTIISTDSSRVKAMVIETNEEIIIARDTYNLIQKNTV